MVLPWEAAGGCRMLQRPHYIFEVFFIILDLRLTEILSDSMNRVFIALGERRKENGAQPWPCLFCGLGRRGGHRQIGSLASLPEGCITGRKRTGKWGCRATSSMMSVSCGAETTLLYFSVHFSSKNEADPRGTILKCLKG